MGPLAVCAAAAVLAGCGGDDKKSSSSPLSPGGGYGDTTQSAPKSKSDAIAQCYEAAKKYTGQARKTAEASCKAADTGDTSDLKKQAKQQCLDGAKQIPDANSRKQAEDACNKLGQ